jgi:hypothetical protein
MGREIGYVYMYICTCTHGLDIIHEEKRSLHFLLLRIYMIKNVSGTSSIPVITSARAYHFLA